MVFGELVWCLGSWCWGRKLWGRKICLRNMEAAEMLGWILNVKFQSLRFCFLKWKIRQWSYSEHVRESTHYIVEVGGVPFFPYFHNVSWVFFFRMTFSNGAMESLETSQLPWVPVVFSDKCWDCQLGNEKNPWLLAVYRGLYYPVI